MNISLEHLELLPKLFEELKALRLSQAMSSEKRWLTTRGLSDYIGYSLDSINKMVQSGVFLHGVHYHKPSKKLLFDRLEVDNWVLGLKSSSTRGDVGLLVDGLYAPETYGHLTGTDLDTRTGRHVDTTPESMWTV